MIREGRKQFANAFEKEVVNDTIDNSGMKGQPWEIRDGRREQCTRIIESLGRRTEINQVCLEDQKYLSRYHPILRATK